jgi:enoyl-CoA hydratase/carnithine racemase
MPDEAPYKHILFDIEDGVATVTFNRPDKMNAFHFPLGAELGRAYARCDEDDAVRVVILTGAGKAFCAGADMGGGGKTFDDVEGGKRAADSGARERRLAAWQVRKPVIAAINGHAIGVGLTLAMQCDLRIVAREAKLGPLVVGNAALGVGARCDQVEPIDVGHGFVSHPVRGVAAR